MVCVPCFIIPVVLFFWRWLIQPYFIRYIWNPWEKKDEQGNVIEKEPEFIKKCENGVCTFMKKADAGSGDGQNLSCPVSGAAATASTTDSKKEN